MINHLDKVQNYFLWRLDTFILRFVNFRIPDIWILDFQVLDFRIFEFWTSRILKNILIFEFLKISLV